MVPIKFMALWVPTFLGATRGECSTPSDRLWGRSNWWSPKLKRVSMLPSIQYLVVNRWMVVAVNEPRESLGLRVGGRVEARNNTLLVLR